MKKIISLSILFFLVGALFALDLDVSAGLAYGFTSATTVDKDSEIKSKKSDNSFGISAGALIGLNKDLGLKVNTQFLFPAKGTTIKVTNKNGDSTETKISNDKAMIFDCFIGPVYTLKSTKTLKLRAGAGLDFAFNKYTNLYEETKLGNLVLIPASSVSTSYLSYGLGLTGEAEYKINKNLFVKFGIDAAYLWGNKVNSKTTIGDKTTESSGDYKANGLYVIPNITAVYKF